MCIRDRLVWEGSDPDTETSNLKYTVYFDTTDGKQDPSDDHKDLTSQELEVSVEAGVYYWRVKTTDGTNASYSIVYSFRVEQFIYQYLYSLIDIIISETYNIESKNNFSKKLKLLIEDLKTKNIDLLDYKSIKSKFVSDFNSKTHQEIYNQIRDLTVWGFKTSKEIALNVLNYNPIPGYQLGCIDIDK